MNSIWILFLCFPISYFHFELNFRMDGLVLGWISWTKDKNKLGLSCAKLRLAWASYQLAFVWLAFTEAAYYA